MSESTPELNDEAYLLWKAQKQKVEDDYISQRWAQLYELQKEWGTQAIKYIIALNSGGAVATLGFIGTAGPSNVPWQAKVTLALFLVGIILGGVMVAHANHTIPVRFKNWQNSVKKYRASESPARFDELCEQDEKALDYDDEEMDKNLGYAAFGCFILACIFGAFGLFLTTATSDQMDQQLKTAQSIMPESIETQ